MSPSEKPRVLYRVEDAAELLSIGRTSVYALIKNGELESVQIGHRRRVPADALAAYVERLRSGIAA